jgi:hypothetical protein
VWRVDRLARPASCRYNEALQEDHMPVVVPSFVWPLDVGASLAVIVYLVLAARRHAPRLAPGVGAVLVAWFALAVALSASGAFVGSPGRPPAIALGVLPPILAGGAALALSPAVRRAVEAIPQPWLIAIQVVRVLGVVFLVLLGRGVLPAQFALPAGWGDIAVGASAPAVAWALARGTRWARPVALAWNALGLADLTVAVTMGALSADGAVRVFTSAPSTAAMAELPLSLIPTFAVPIFVLLHLASLSGLRAAARDARAARGARATPAHSAA